MPKGVGVPSGRGVVDAAGDFAYGLGGGGVYQLVTRMTGVGLIGALASGALAGSVVKGNRGEIIATMAGFVAAGTPEVQGLINAIPVPRIGGGS